RPFPSRRSRSPGEPPPTSAPTGEVRAVSPATWSTWVRPISPRRRQPLTSTPAFRPRRRILIWWRHMTLPATYLRAPLRPPPRRAIRRPAAEGRLHPRLRQAAEGVAGEEGRPRRIP